MRPSCGVELQKMSGQLWATEVVDSNDLDIAARRGLDRAKKNSTDPTETVNSNTHFCHVF